MNSQHLVLFNTCGINGKDNIDFYIKHIQSILDQDLENIKIVQY